MNLCRCCGEEIPALNAWGNPRKFKTGHVRKGLASNINLRATRKSTGYWRSKRIIQANSCRWEHIGSCKGLLDRCHIDGNPLHNVSKNLIVLCRSHHRLMDHGHIDPANPVMPQFYTDRGGKRRYAKKS